MSSRVDHAFTFRSSIAGGESGPFVGRAVELAKLQAALARVLHGHPEVVHILGPSGIGKSELVRRFVAPLEDEGTMVLRGRCHPQESVPYNALDTVIDALSRRLVLFDDAEMATLIPEHAAALVRLFPVLGRVPRLAGLAQDEAAEPHETRRRGFGALRLLLGRLAERQRLVVCIDDLQWSDVDSVALLRELLRPPEAPAMLVLLTYRSDEREHIPFFAPGEEAVLASAEEIVLGPLDAAESQELAQRLCAAQIESDRRLADIIAESAGNPFFIGELARALDAGSTIGATSAPLHLRLGAVMQDRMQQLSATARQLLEVVSVAGGPLPRSVALAATGIGERGRPMVARLEQRSLLRTVTLKDEVAVEVYHDRVREALLGSLSPDVLQARHGSLAEVFESQPAPDAEALFRHCLGAGRRERAADWAVQAAERADAALAFARAAELYGRALELKAWDEARAAALKAGQAHALVNAGRGAEAAPMFLAAALLMPPDQQLDLRRRAAEQFLVSGHMDEGAAVVRTLLKDIRLRYPRSSSGAVLGTIARTIPLWLSDARPRAGASATPPELARFDTCHSIAKGLVLVDPIRGLYFAVRMLSLAVRAGDVKRTGLAAASLGVALLPLGGVLGRWAERLVTGARESAEATRDPYLLGFTAIAMAQLRMVQARWREMLALCDTGTELMRAQCRGVAWEIAIGRMAALRALEELGEMSEWVRRAEQLLRGSQEMGDTYGVVSGLLPKGLSRVISGDFAGAGALAQRVLAAWTPSGFHMQHFYVFRLLAYCDIGQQSPRQAWARIESNWPKVQRSGMLRHGLLRADAHLLRARAALAIASSESGDRAAMLAHADRDATRLAGEGRPDTDAHALVVRAGAAAVRGDRPRAVELLSEAARGFEAAGMDLCLALARRRAGELVGGAGGPLLLQANQYFERERIADPQALLRMYAPGFD